MGGVDVKTKFGGARLHSIRVTEDSELTDVLAQEVISGLKNAVIVPLWQHNVALISLGALQQPPLETLWSHHCGDLAAYDLAKPLSIVNGNNGNVEIESLSSLDCFLPCENNSEYLAVTLSCTAERQTNASLCGLCVAALTTSDNDDTGTGDGGDAEVKIEVAGAGQNSRPLVSSAVVLNSTDDGVKRGFRIHNNLIHSGAVSPTDSVEATCPTQCLRQCRNDIL